MSDSPVNSKLFHAIHGVLNQLLAAISAAAPGKCIVVLSQIYMAKLFCVFTKAENHLTIIRRNYPEKAAKEIHFHVR